MDNRMITNLDVLTAYMEELNSYLGQPIERKVIKRLVSITGCAETYCAQAIDKAIADNLIHGASFSTTRILGRTVYGKQLCDTFELNTTIKNHKLNNT